MGKYSPRELRAHYVEMRGLGADDMERLTDADRAELAQHTLRDTGWVDGVRTFRSTRKLTHTAKAALCEAVAQFSYWDNVEAPNQRCVIFYQQATPQLRARPASVRPFPCK